MFTQRIINHIRTYKPHYIVGGVFGTSFTANAILDWNRENSEIEAVHPVVTNTSANFPYAMETLHNSLTTYRNWREIDPLLYIKLNKSSCPEMVYLNQQIDKTIAQYDISGNDRRNASQTALSTHHLLARRLVRRALLRKGYICKYTKFLVYDELTSVVIAPLSIMFLVYLVSV